MNCPKCSKPTTKQGFLDKVKVLGSSGTKFDINVVVILCRKCQTILGIVNVP